MKTKYSKEEILKKINGRFWYHSIELPYGIVTPGVDGSREKVDKFQFPKNVKGKTVLDIGAYDGFFSFLAEQQGASKVVAFDHFPPDSSGFNTVKDILSSNVSHILGSIYDIDSIINEKFDIVLFYGVLYHLRHPLLAIEKLRKVCKEVLLLESQVLDSIYKDGNYMQNDKETRSTIETTAVAQLFPRNELYGDYTNWFAFNAKAIKDLLDVHGFNVHKVNEFNHRASFSCTIRNEELPEWVVNY